ncbi:MAG: hypothetical protein AB8F74_21800, partial [Saprospiraceae bacterium]
MQLTNIKLFFYLLLVMTTWNFSSCGKEELKPISSSEKDLIKQIQNNSNSINPFQGYEKLLLDRLWRAESGAPLDVLPVYLFTQPDGSELSSDDLAAQVANDYQTIGFDKMMDNYRQGFPDQTALINSGEQFKRDLENIITSSTNLDDILLGLQQKENDVANSNIYAGVEKEMLFGLVGTSRAAIEYHHKVAWTKWNSVSAEERNDSECDEWWQSAICVLVAATPAIIAGIVAGTIAASNPNGTPVCMVDATGNMIYFYEGDPAVVGIITGAIVAFVTAKTLFYLCCDIFFKDYFSCYTPYTINPPFGCDASYFHTFGGEDVISYLWQVENLDDGDDEIDYSE